MSRNAEVAEILTEFADLLAARNVEYKPRAYRRAADNILDSAIAIEELAADGEDAVMTIEGVGDAIASKVVEYLDSGEIEELEELREAFPVRMDELTAVEGVGPKSVGSFYEALGITTLDELESAAEAGEIREISGFGQKTEENILENIPFAREAKRRELLGHGRPVADEVLAYLRGLSAVDRADVAGSIRRWGATIGDIDLLVATSNRSAVMEAFTEWDRVERVMLAGEEKASVRARGIQVDLRLVDPDEWGAALQYFTGNKDHNVRVRNRAIDRDLKMNEYGIFDVSELSDEDAEADRRAGERIGGDSEESMYAALDLPLMAPELREDTGEVEAAANDDLPSIITGDDIRGDLHVHTTWSDGKESIANMAAEAASFGHDYIAICDHATGPGMVGGVGIDDDELASQADEIHAIDDDSDIRILAGVEANIDGEGKISVSDDVLASLDLVVASPHSGLDQDSETATDRLVRAIEHPNVDVIGHPTGRLLNRRAGMDIDVTAVAAAAAEHDTALEVNANPSRLDLDGSMVRVAVDTGAPIAINTDAHSPGEYANIRYGVHTARRGWAGAPDVINSWTEAELESWLKR